MNKKLENNLFEMVKGEVYSLRENKEWKKLQGLHLRLLRVCGDKRLGADRPYSAFGFSPKEIRFWGGVLLMAKNGASWTTNLLRTLEGA